MTTPNAELAYKVLDHIDAHPEQWRQDVYIGKAECGTVACFAGWACLLSGDKPLFDSVELVGLAGLRGSVSDRAQNLLGASRWIDEDTEGEADLFDQYNTREMLGEFVEEVFGPRPGGDQ